LALFFVVILLAAILMGCSPSLSTAEQVENFERAGPTGSESNAEGMTFARASTGPYRVVPGDILEFQMPAVLRVISSDLPEWFRPAYGHQDIESYLARVSIAGTITLPIVGEIIVGGKTLAQIEAQVIDAYFPKYVVNRPMVVCQVTKYQSEYERVFTVLGLVNQPNAFPYPPDVQYSLMEALAFAGGLDMTADPRYLKIFRQDSSGEVASATFRIDGPYLAKACGLVVKPGDVVYVDHTLRTRINKFLSEVLAIRVGADFRTTSDD
jgi:protein involved in polysaccharide export with SLBB domain